MDRDAIERLLALDEEYKEDNASKQKEIQEILDIERKNFSLDKGLEKFDILYLQIHACSDNIRASDIALYFIQQKIQDKLEGAHTLEELLNLDREEKDQIINKYYLLGENFYDYLKENKKELLSNNRELRFLLALQVLVIAYKLSFEEGPAIKLIGPQSLKINKLNNKLFLDDSLEHNHFEISKSHYTSAAIPESDKHDFYLYTAIRIMGFCKEYTHSHNHISHRRTESIVSRERFENSANQGLFLKDPFIFTPEEIDKSNLNKIIKMAENLKLEFNANFIKCFKDLMTIIKPQVDDKKQQLIYQYAIEFCSLSKKFGKNVSMPGVKNDRLSIIVILYDALNIVITTASNLDKKNYAVMELKNLSKLLTASDEAVKSKFLKIVINLNENRNISDPYSSTFKPVSEMFESLATKLGVDYDEAIAQSHSGNFLNDPVGSLFLLFGAGVKKTEEEPTKVLE
ncbi:hypothetical protein L3V79_02850 [Thiotrichales bacterium 19S9-12]|nr:hypothetical protein [Thiotrichales bacterium 19S9-11]MCF6811297.1 hypothetical protein [Thiotrichales bacterium 19S9-12]